MDRALIDTLIRIAVPFLITWNIFLFNKSQTNQEELHNFELYVAQNYTSKADLEKMIDDMEGRLEKQLNAFVKTMQRGD